MYDMLHEYLQHYDIPVCYDFPVGHSHLKNFPMPIGTRTTLRVTSSGATVSFN